MSAPDRQLRWSTFLSHTQQFADLTSLAFASSLARGFALVFDSTERRARQCGLQRRLRGVGALSASSVVHVRVHVLESGCVKALQLQLALAQ
jgi:hypothetical protein